GWEPWQLADLSFVPRLRITEPHYPVQRILFIFAFAPEYLARRVGSFDRFWRPVFCISHSIQRCRILVLPLLSAFRRRARRGELFLRRSWRSEEHTSELQS